MEKQDGILDMLDVGASNDPDWAMPSEEGTPQEQPPQELDSAGFPWDARIHTEAKTKVKAGTWKLRRKVDKDLVATVREETAKSTPAPEEEPQTSPRTSSTLVCSQCGADEKACEHVAAPGYTMVTRDAYAVMQAKRATETQPVAEQPTPTQPTTQITADLVIAKYVETRDAIAALKKKFEESVATMESVQEKREAWLKGELTRQGLKSFKGDHGTAFFGTGSSATVADGVAFLNWVHEDWENRKSFLNNSVSKSAVTQQLEDKKPLPPGVNYSTFKSIKIRRS